MRVDTCVRTICKFVMCQGYTNGFETQSITLDSSAKNHTFHVVWDWIICLITRAIIFANTMGIAARLRYVFSIRRVFGARATTFANTKIRTKLNYNILLWNIYNTTNSEQFLSSRFLNYFGASIRHTLSHTVSREDTLIERSNQYSTLICKRANSFVVLAKSFKNKWGHNWRSRCNNLDNVLIAC